LFEAPLGGTTLEAPTITGGRLVVGTMTGLVEGFAFADPPARVPRWAAAAHVSRKVGFVSVDTSPGRCMCATRQYYTYDRGRTWHETATVSSHFAASAGRLYFWTPTRLSLLAQLPRRTSSSRLAATSVATLADGTIKRVEPIPGGVAVLVSSRVHGQGWDTAPRVILVHGTTTDTETLPTTRGRPLVQTLTVAWPKLTVTATDFVANPARAAVWVSPDGGGTWSLG
jgi:hypothetical protein